MPGFVESEAEESEDEIINKKRKRTFQDEDDEEEEEDDEEQLREEMKDLINDDDDEEDDGEDKEDSEEEIVQKKKKHHDDYDDALEDDDYDLIEENLGVKVQRKKKFKRLRRIEDEESDDAAEGEDEREAIANELFEGDDMEGDDEEPRPAEDDTIGNLEESEGESDENDFIVDDDGQPVSKGKKKKHVKYNNVALQEAQDIFGVDFDYADFAQGDDYEDEIDEDYEDDEEGAGEGQPKQKKVARKQTTRKTIYDIFEPVVLERSHMTDLDKEIKSIDIPERFQLRAVPVTEASSEEIEEEADWIYKQAFSIPTISIQGGEHSDTGHQPIAGHKNPSAVGKIKEALKFIRNDKFEVPFIAFYRKEYVEPDLNINDLWTVYKYDEKWYQLRTRKNNLNKLFEMMQRYQSDITMSDPDKPVVEGIRPLEAGDILRLKKSQSMEEVQDCYSHFMLYYGHDVPSMKDFFKKKQQEEKELEGKEDEEADAGDTKIKHISHTDAYMVCKQSGIDGLAKKFGLTPEQFGENLFDNYQRHEVDQYPVEPKEVATDYICKRFPTGEDCLSVAKFMVATQIAREPAVRKCVRQIFFERSRITVRPTKKGIKEIDENHPCYSTKYLTKPVKDLKRDQFLKLIMAERKEDVKITIDMSRQGGKFETYLDEIKQLYECDKYSKNVQEWNVQRRQVLDIALTKMLYPSFEKELRLKLLNESLESVRKACCRKLYNWLKVAPYQLDPQVEEEDDFDTREGIRVLAIAYQLKSDVPAFCTIIDGDGEVIEVLRLPYLLNRRNSFKEKDRFNKISDLNRLKDFILKKRPHVVVVSGESRDALMIVSDVKDIISELMDSDQFPLINVEIMDNELAVLYSKSNKGESDYRDYPELLRQAISLARRLQDPLIEFSQMCTPDEDILCLKYHPLQDELNKDDLLNSLYLEFVNRTNEVGVDFSRAIQFSHAENIVQFICGLGPRKGTFLIKALKAANHPLESRTQLITFCKMGPKVFVNCAGFIKIDTSVFVDSTETFIEVLDGSRIHPEAYEWARKMAVDALEYDDMQDENPAGALEEILENPEKLNYLDLDAFAEELERQNFGNKSITLYDIRAELNHKYKDLRTPYNSPNAEEVFNILTKETPESLYIGKMVLCCVINIARRKLQHDQLENANPIRNETTNMWQCPFCMRNNFRELNDVWSHFDNNSCEGKAVGVRVRLDNGLSGFIPTKMISDKYVANPQDRVKPQMTLHARITKIDIERFAADLTCRSSDLADKNNEWRPPKDPYYDYDAEEQDRKKVEDSTKKQNRQVYLKRVIIHPNFKNIGFKEAEKFLESRDQGEVIIRPSSKGKNHLTITWKVAEGINQHIDVKEVGKENDFSLGHSLIIGEESFEDLDEIIARHVQPMAGFARDLLNFKYFVDANGGKKDEMERLLMEKKKKFPSYIAYYVSASRDFPGKFLLSYLPKNKVRHEFIKILPDGFGYRSHMFPTFKSVNFLFRYFKENYNKYPIPDSTPSVMPVRTPLGQSTYSCNTPNSDLTNSTSSVMSICTPSGQSTYIGNTPNINRTNSTSSVTPVRTSLRQSTYTGSTPNITLTNIDQQIIERAAANMPNHLFNTLSQVTGQTSAIFQGASNFTSSYNDAYDYQPYSPTQPAAIATPFYDDVPTDAYSQAPSPQQDWSHPSSQTPFPSTPNISSSIGNPASAEDWKLIAEQWVKKQQLLRPGQITPRTPMHNSPSSMNLTPADATPLIDEF